MINGYHLEFRYNHLPKMNYTILFLSFFACAGKGHFTYTPKPNRNRTEKLKCLKPYGRFHICAETETEPKPNAEPKTCTILILFFSDFGGRISANTTGNFDKICTYTTTCVVYNLVIMKDIDGLSSETTVRLFYKHNTIDYRILWDNTQRL